MPPMIAYGILALRRLSTRRCIVLCSLPRPSKNMSISFRRLSKSNVRGLNGIEWVLATARDMAALRGLEQFADRLHAVIHQRQRSVLRAGQLMVRVEAEAFVDCGGDFGGIDRPGL